MIEIFLCDESDLEEISILWEQMIRECEPTSIPSKDLWINHIKAYMKHPDFAMYAAACDNGDNICGYITGMLMNDPAFSRIVALGLEFYVYPSYRDGSVALRLYHTLVAEGRKRGAKEIRLICYNKTLPLWESKGMICKSFLMSKEI